MTYISVFRPVLLLFFICFCFSSMAGCGPKTGGEHPPPYPQSELIKEVVFDWSSHQRMAPGSDNWPVTWADDDHQYTSWGDGGGFGGTNDKGRVSLGFARVEGDADNYKGINIWGGLNPENPAEFGGKSYGVLCVEGVLYKWVSPKSGHHGYKEARLHKSKDHGASWERAGWAFERNDEIILPTFLQFGKDYQGARDAYVYVYAITVKYIRKLSIQVPGEICLMRVPKDKIMKQEAYEYYKGLDGDKNPVWTDDMDERKPVFEDANGVGWTCAASYNPGLKRYFLTTEHNHSFKGNLGLFESVNPWGPWRVVTYLEKFGSPDIQPTAFFWNFSNKWLDASGENFTMVFTGIRKNDSWNTVKGRFVLNISK